MRILSALTLMLTLSNPAAAITTWPDGQSFPKGGVFCGFLKLCPKVAGPTVGE